MLEPIKRKSLTETIIGRILDLIKLKLKPGDKLPSEKMLMESLAVGRSSLREAMRSLEMMGIVETRAGEGSFVASNTSARFQKPLEWSVYGAEGDLFAVYEARRSIEPAIVALAVSKITDDEIDELMSLFKKMETLKSRKDHSDFFDLDYLIHKKIAEFARNDFLKEVIWLTNRIMQVTRKDTHKASEIEELIIYHRELVYAIAERDKNKSIKAMENHFDLTKRLLKL